MGRGIKKNLLFPGSQKEIHRQKGRKHKTAIRALYVLPILSPGISDSCHRLEHVLAQTDSSLNPSLRRRSWSFCFLPVLPVNGCGVNGSWILSGDQPSPPGSLPNAAGQRQYRHGYPFPFSQPSKLLFPKVSKLLVLGDKISWPVEPRCFPFTLLRKGRKVN